VNDQTAAALGAGLCTQGDVTLGLGTALVAYQVIEPTAPPHPARLLRGPYVGGLAYQLALSSTAGAAVSWVREVLAPGVEADRLYSEALAVTPGCDGLRARPDFGDAPGSSGGLFGLTLAHTRAHIFRAVLEGVACVAREKLDLLSAREPVRVTGGGSANDGWMQVLADVTGRTLERAEQPHAGLWGTALLAGQGAGLFGDVLHAVQSTRRAGRRFTPCRAHASVYARVFDDYVRLKGV
jgi:sugar (pentulose or hexulose) kinase